MSGATIDRSDPIWPNQTTLEELLLGKQYHHDLHCNADRRKPMGCDMCSCKYREGRMRRVIEGTKP